MNFATSCDTMVVMGSVTSSGNPIFAKNSDREPNEAQHLIRVPRKRHNDEEVACSHISIPQVKETYGFIGSQPWWLWGLEHGVNEFGLAVGNEAAWSRDRASTDPGLIGMDYVRLALERAATASEALEVVTSLLADYGQSGPCSFTSDTAYQNSFIFADPKTAWVLETSGRNWIAKEVENFASISNVYSIGTDYDLISPDAISHAAEQGWYDPQDTFNWTAVYTDPTLDRLPSCRQRLARSGSLLEKGSKGAAIDPETMMEYLRDHDDASGFTGSNWAPSDFSEGSICMHAASTSGFETAASMVAELHGDVGRSSADIWASLASPCMSVFTPVWTDLEIPSEYSSKSSDRSDFWWRIEQLQRRTEAYFDIAYPVVHALVQKKQQQLANSHKGSERGDLVRLGRDTSVELLVEVESILDALQLEARFEPTDRRRGYLEAVEEAARALVSRSELADVKK